MERFVEKPNLPAGQVSEVIMSDYKPHFKRELERMGIYVTVPHKISTIVGSEAYHADMSVCHIGKNQIYFADKLLEPVTAKKPLLNICIFGNHVICNTKKAYTPILDILKANHMSILHTNQSYAKCSCAVVGENAIITSDESIYRICVNHQIDVLKISSGDIALDGYEYGFIGGCCGLISKNTLAFSGNIQLHRDYANIKSFTGKYHIELLSLSNEKLYDIGGILPIKEKVSK